jgi:hypothetical protein
MFAYQILIIVIYLTSSCVNWAFFSMSGPESNYKKHFIFSPQN